MSAPQPADPQPADPQIAALHARITALEADNADLAARVGATDPTERPSKRPHRRRGALAVGLIVLGTLLAPFGVVATWAGATLTDTDGFVSTYAPVVRDPAVQGYLRDRTVAAVESKVDTDALVSDLVDGLSGMFSERPRAAAAVRLLEQPAAYGVRSAIAQATDRVVTSDAFATTWEQALRLSHIQMIGALNGDPQVVATITADGLGLRLGPIVDRVRGALTEQGFALAAAIPAVDRTIVVVPSADLARVQAWYRFGVAVGGWLPWVCLGLVVAGVLVANRRRSAMVGAAVALAVVGLVLVGGLAIARLLLPAVVPAAVVPAPVLDIFFLAATTALADTARVLLTLGVVVAVLGWAYGPSRGATRLRGGWRRVATAVRTLRDRYGLGTGRFGAWLRGHRAWVGIGVVAVAVGLLFTDRPLSIGRIVGTALVALLVLALARLLEVGEAPPVKDGAAG